MEAREFWIEAERMLTGEERAKLAPLRVDRVRLSRGLRDPAGTVELLWGERGVDLELYARPETSTSDINSALELIRGTIVGGETPTYPALLVPFLSQLVRSRIRGTGVSAIDLNGNYIIQTPDFLALRLDQENAFPESRYIQKIYSSNSSIVGRFFLTEKRIYERVGEIHERLAAIGGDISLSTVSKVLSGLAADVIIEKERGRIRLLQPDALLDRLVAGYLAPKLGTSLQLKLPGDLTAQEAVLSDALGDEWIWTGDTSAGRYATTTPPQVRGAYTRSPDLGSLEEYVDTRFYNCVIERTEDAYVYFDRRDTWASPVEAYLDLMQRDKRERQVAAAIRRDILAPWKEQP